MPGLRSPVLDGPYAEAPRIDEAVNPFAMLAIDRRIGEDGLLAKKRPTSIFNGYEAQVGQLCAGMDLRKLY